MLETERAGIQIDLVTKQANVVRYQRAIDTLPNEGICRT
jgi:hypothetical protein